MITCMKNNFGADEIRFEDWQSERLCVLNGVFTIDPLSEDYRAAERLEVTLPADFKMRRSAVSSAVLMSGNPQIHNGTVLRCWIENRVLCIEKIDCWDEFGEITITVASAFVTRGYRGEFEETVISKIEYEGAAASRSVLVIKDGIAALSAYFSSFPRSDSSGPHVVAMKGFPKDVDALIPIVVGGGSYQNGQKGTALVIGRIQNGHMHLRYDKGAVNLGGPNTFVCLFAVRGTYQPSEPSAGAMRVSGSDVSGIDGTQVSGLSFCAADAALSLDAQLVNGGDSCPFPVAVSDEAAENAPYSLRSFCLGRSGSGKVALKSIIWSRLNRALTFEKIYSSDKAQDMHFFGTQLITSVNW